MREWGETDRDEPAAPSSHQIVSGGAAFVTVSITSDFAHKLSASARRFLRWS